MFNKIRKCKCTCCGECWYFCRPEGFADIYKVDFEPFAMCVNSRSVECGEVHHKNDAPCKKAKRA